MSRTFLTIDDVAERLAVSRRWVARRIEAGELPSYKLGHLVRVAEPDLDAWLMSQKAEPREANTA